MNDSSKQTPEAQWFVAIDDQSVGPIDAPRMQEYLSANEVTTESLVWREGMELWTPLGQCEPLQEQLAGLVPTPPPLPAATAGAASAPPPASDDDKLAAEWGVDFSTPQNVSQMPSILPPPIAGTGRAWKLLAILGLLVAVGAVVALIVVMGKEPPRAVEKEKIVHQTQVVYRDRPVAAVADSDTQPEEGGVDSDSAQRPPIPSPAVRRGKRPSRPETAAERKKRLMAELADSGDGIKLKGGTVQSRPAEEPGGAGDSLSQKQMRAVVSKHRGSLQLCYERAMKSGAAPTDRDLKVTFTVSVGRSGMVKSARLAGSGTGYTSLKNCLHTSVKKWMFPASTGNSQVQFPIVFTPAR